MMRVKAEVVVVADEVRKIERCITEDESSEGRKTSSNLCDRTIKNRRRKRLVKRQPDDHRNRGELHK